MKKVFVSLFLGLFLTACAGNPPAWWNPGNTYSSTGRQSVSEEKPRTPQKTPVERVLPIPTEENISVADESYEEMILTPSAAPVEEMPSSAEEGTPSEEPEDAFDAPVSSSDRLPLPSVLE